MAIQWNLMFERFYKYLAPQCHFGPHVWYPLQSYWSFSVHSGNHCDDQLHSWLVFHWVLFRAQPFFHYTCCPWGLFSNQHKVLFHCCDDDIQMDKPFKLKSKGSLRSLLVVDCIKDTETWLSLHFLKLNESKAEATVFGPPGLLERFSGAVFSSCSFLS